VSALRNGSVGDYLNRHFVSGFQKVATFTVAGEVKQGGNVAGYFCTPDGMVLHAFAGPVSANQLLREARWANETYNLARMEDRNTVSLLRSFFRKAHAERLEQEHHIRVPVDRLPVASLSKQGLALILDRNMRLSLGNEGKLHLLLAAAPLPRIEQIYQVVFEKILRERVSTNPVAVAGL
jgi:hypothetical protein